MRLQRRLAPAISRGELDAVRIAHIGAFEQGHRGRRVVAGIGARRQAVTPLGTACVFFDKRARHQGGIVNCTWSPGITVIVSEMGFRRAPIGCNSKRTCGESLTMSGGIANTWVERLWIMPRRRRTPDDRTKTSMSAKF